VESAVSFADAGVQAQAQLKANPYSAGAGDYLGYDASSGSTNPADMIAFFAPTQAQANALALSWGKTLVHGGVWLATSPADPAYAFTSSISQAATTAEAGSYSGFFPGIAVLDSGVDAHATSALGVTFYSFTQQSADNMAAYTPYKVRPLPTIPEVCYQGARTNTLSLLSWECPAHWTMLKPAKAPSRIICVKGTTVRRVTKVNPRCPVGWKKR
jgi:hypothetical protein